MPAGGIISTIPYPKSFKQGAFQVFGNYDNPGSSMWVLSASPHSNTHCKAASHTLAGSGTPMMRMWAIGK